MAVFYFDHGTADDVAAHLETEGHDVLTTLRHGRIRAPDDEQLLTAFQLGRILVTHNARDFVLVHHAWRLWPTALGIGWPAHPGILVIPQPPAITIARAADEIDKSVRSGRRIANELYHLAVPGGWRRER